MSELTRDQEYIVKLTNKKEVIKQMSTEWELTGNESRCLMAGYQQAIDYLCHIMDEEDEG